MPSVGGDIILIHGGVYQEPSKLDNRRGSFGKPIIIRAADDKWISGGRSPDPYWGDEVPGEGPAKNPPRKPNAKDFAFLVVDECVHLRIEGLKIRDCWPSIFFLKNSCHVVIRNCTLRNGSFAIVAKDTPDEGPLTSHLLVDGNEWQQDDSDEHLLWTRIDWARAHGGEKADGMFRHFNGAFLYSKGIRGNVVVRANRIMDAYNGVRMKAGNDELPEESLPKLNADVHIVGNDFIRIRDNPIEPEVAAYNWHVRHNRLTDCHSWFSFDGVGGGYWYFYGNTGNFESRQGIPGEFGHTMGRVLKLSYEADPPPQGSIACHSHPWFVFNNSWHLRCPLIGGANPTIPKEGEGRPGFHRQSGVLQQCIRLVQQGPLRLMDMRGRRDDQTLRLQEKHGNKLRLQHLRSDLITFAYFQGACLGEAQRPAQQPPDLRGARGRQVCPRTG